ncbi:MAG: HAD family hydrolase [Planctomycetota bacterium]
MRYRIGVFDFDGTLVDTCGPIALAVRGVLEAWDIEMPPETEFLHTVGLPLDELFRRFATTADDRQIERMCELYRERFRKVVRGRTRMYDGVAETVTRLRGAGVRLAIATSRGMPSLVQILEDHGLCDAFDFLVSHNCVERGKPHPEMLQRVLGHFDSGPADALMVGDTTFDMTMGRAARIDTCAVTYGLHAAEDLRRERPTHTVDRASDLPAVFGLG